MLEKAPERIVGDVTHQDVIDTNLSGLNILLVEDGDTNRKLIRVTLTRSGANVATAENGKIALQLAASEPFDLVLMDMQMPIMDGYTATRILRDRGFTRPIIALTAHAMKGDREKCEEAGCSGYLSKPINMDELVRTVLAATRGAGVRPSRLATAMSQGEFQTAAPLPKEVRSSLPTDDPEIHAIVCEFVEKLSVSIEKMDAACCKADYDELAKLAHWLKGAGGTVGFDCFTEPAKQLEKFAKEKASNKIGDTLQRLRSLEKVLTV
jgi:CheY-like chemotaxis protein/HPt (histidine-containing phosphotransfer) domain-containing protein